MRVRRPLSHRCAALALVGASLVASAAAAAEGFKAELQARYAALKSAMAAQDGAAVGAFLAADFVSVDLAGKEVAGPELIAQVNGLKPDPNKVSTTTLVSFSEAGGAVTVEQRYDMKTNQAAADGVAHDIELVTLSTDTWIKPGDAWLLQRTVTHEVSYFRDGKTVVHRVKPE